MDMDKMELLKAIKQTKEAQFGSLAADLDAWLEEMKPEREARKTTDLEANPEEMRSEAEHQEVRMEVAVVKPVGGRKKRHRGGIELQVNAESQRN
jgi:hypothetical protein